MTTQQHPAQFDWATELSDVQGHVTLSKQEAKEIGARLRSMGAENETLRAYCQELEAQVILDCMTHVQNPVEIEHIAGDVSKNGAELNMSTQQPVAQQEAQEPVAWYVTGCGRLLDEDEAKAEARHIGGTARAIPVYTAPLPSPTAQGDALSDDAVRVPLDSLHADAAYLIGRLREGSMPYARVIEIIRERIDAAKAAIRARAAQGDALDAARYRAFRDCSMDDRNRLEHYSGPALDVAIDTFNAARKQGANHD